MSAPTTAFSSGAGTIAATAEANGLYADVDPYTQNPRLKLGFADAGAGTFVLRGRLRGLPSYYYIPLRSLKTGLPLDPTGFTPASGEAIEADVTGCDRYEVYASALSTTASLEERVEAAAPGASPIIVNASANASTFSAGLTLNGATGVNLVSVPDNLASALDITEGSNSYIKVVTTNGSESVDVGKVINAAAGVQGVVANEIVTATNVITAAESGKTFFLNSATEFVSTLPAVAAGLRFTFICTAAPSGASYTIVTNSSSNIIKGNQNSVAGDAGDFGTADDTITFVDGQAVAGDKVELWSDGTSWFAYAISKVAAGITFTQAS